MTTVSEEKEGQEAVPPEAAPESLCGQVRTRASSVAPPTAASLGAVTQRVRAAGQVASRVGALLDRPGSLVHSQPPTFRQARDRHHECACHYRHPLLRWQRLLYGYFHLLVIKPALNLAEWVTESQARFVVAALIVAAVWFFT
jgi:hypothetical protein